jgi:hypothetical protein
VFRSGVCATINDSLCQQTDLSQCVQKYNCWEHDASTGAGGTIALTTVTYDTGTGEIVDADMELHGWNGQTGASTSGWYFTCPGSGSTCTAKGQTGCVDMDIGNTVTHEAGHMLGLDHVCTGTSPAPGVGDCPALPFPVMAPTASEGDVDKRILKPDDIEAVCTVYPNGRPTLLGAATTAPPYPTQPVGSAPACPTSSPGGTPGSGNTGGGCGQGAATGAGLALLAGAWAAWRRRAATRRAP